LAPPERGYESFGPCRREQLHFDEMAGVAESEWEHVLMVEHPLNQDTWQIKIHHSIFGFSQKYTFMRQYHLVLILTEILLTCNKR
jgi:hypothetical protein